MKPIVVAGRIDIDFVAQVERLPGPGETVAGVNFETHNGGKGAKRPWWPRLTRMPPAAYR
jgi:ribokinase